MEKERIKRGRYSLMNEFKICRTSLGESVVMSFLRKEIVSVRSGNRSRSHRRSPWGGRDGSPSTSGAAEYERER